VDTREHWDKVYRTKSITEVSWYQREPRVSLDLITRVAPELSSRIVDVGGGASTFVDGLLSRGYRNVTVLDIASAAIQAAQERLGLAAANASWVVADALVYAFPAWPPRRTSHSGRRSG